MRKPQNLKIFTIWPLQASAQLNAGKVTIMINNTGEELLALMSAHIIALQHLYHEGNWLKAHSPLCRSYSALGIYTHQVEQIRIRHRCQP